MWIMCGERTFKRESNFWLVHLRRIVREPWDSPAWGKLDSRCTLCCSCWGCWFVSSLIFEQSRHTWRRIAPVRLFEPHWSSCVVTLSRIWCWLPTASAPLPLRLLISPPWCCLEVIRPELLNEVFIWERSNSSTMLGWYLPYVSCGWLIDGLAGVYLYVE